MLDTVLRFIEIVDALPLWVGLGLLGLGALIEYLAPPFPGDMVVVAGALLVPTAGWPWWGVLGATTLGSVLGAALNWWVGTWLARTERETWLHRLLYGSGRRAKIDRIIVRFERRGAIYLLINRFIPAFRSLFFIAAGLARLSLGRVLGFAALSALLWNAALLGLGWALGGNIERLVGLVENYTRVVFFAIVAGALIWGVSRLWRAHRAGRGGESSG